MQYAKLPKNDNKMSFRAGKVEILEVMKYGEGVIKKIIFFNISNEGILFIT